MTATTELKPSGTAHILLDERGRGWIEGTRVRVDQVVADVIGVNQMSAQDIVNADPDSGLTLANVYAAMSWYHDHKDEIDAGFERLQQIVDAGREAQRKRPQFQKILAIKALRDAETNGIQE